MVENVSGIFTGRPPRAHARGDDMPINLSFFHFARIVVGFFFCTNIQFSFRIQGRVCLSVYCQNAITTHPLACVDNVTTNRETCPQINTLLA